MLLYYCCLTDLIFVGLLTDMNNAKFALLIAQIPENPNVPKHKTLGEEVDSWKRFLATSPKKSDPTKGLIQLQNNVWQIDLATGMRALCEIWMSADKWGIPVRVLFLEETPAWLEYPEHEATFP
jgi:hypothetical protein